MTRLPTFICYQLAEEVDWKERAGCPLEQSQQSPACVGRDRGAS